MPTVALISWPFIGLIIFFVLGPARGLIWTVVIGYLFLPENFGFDLLGLPPYDKKNAITLSILLPSMLYWGKVEKASNNDPLFRWVVIACIFAMILGAYGSHLQNQNTLFNGPVIRDRVSLRDALSLISDTILFFLPMFLAWHFLRRPEDHRHLLVAVVIMGLFYTLLVLFELRMSPQLNKWIYGYFPHNWRQHLRSGGYRPLVFLQHGLWLGFFLLTVSVAAVALFREKKGTSFVLYLLAGIWCFLVLAISRNLGATMLAFMFIPVALFLSFRMQAKIATIFAVILLAYPVLSTASLTPAYKLLETVEPIAPDRAESFKFRLDNEAILLDRAMEKPLFGWGGNSRQRYFDAEGRDLTLIDGMWIVQLGNGGWVRYLAYFGLLAAPIFFLRRAARRKPISAPVAGMAVIMAANFVYLIPNSSLSPIGLIILGAMAAFVQYDTVKVGEVPAPEAPTPDRPTSQYSRFPQNQAAARRPALASRPLTRSGLRQGGRT